MWCDGAEGTNRSRSHKSGGRGLWRGSLRQRGRPLREALQGVSCDPHQSLQRRSSAAIHARTAARAAPQGEYRRAAWPSRRTGGAAQGATSHTGPRADPT